MPRKKQGVHKKRGALSSKQGPNSGVHMGRKGHMTTAASAAAPTAATSPATVNVLLQNHPPSSSSTPPTTDKKDKPVVPLKLKILENCHRRLSLTDTPEEACQSLSSCSPKSVSDHRASENTLTLNERDGRMQYLHKKFKKPVQEDEFSNDGPRRFEFSHTSEAVMNHGFAPVNSVIKSANNFSGSSVLCANDDLALVPEAMNFSAVPKNLFTDGDDIEGGEKTNFVSSGNKYVCPYCGHACTKPSVLEKHIRAHTNERPYPCIPCGFAFKTKSNLYKHCKSRAHALKVGSSSSSSIGNDEFDVENGGYESDSEDARPDSSLSNSSGFDHNGAGGSMGSLFSTSSAIYKPKFHSAGMVTINSVQDDVIQPSLISVSDLMRKHEDTLAALEYKQDDQLVPSPICSKVPEFSRSILEFLPQLQSTNQQLERPPGTSTSSQSNGGGIKFFESVKDCQDLSKIDTDMIQEHISRIISVNSALVQTFNPISPRRYVRQSSISTSKNIELELKAKEKMRRFSENFTSSISFSTKSKLATALQGKDDFMKVYRTKFSDDGFQPHDDVSRSSSSDNPDMVMPYIGKLRSASIDVSGISMENTNTVDRSRPSSIDANLVIDLNRHGDRSRSASIDMSRFMGVDRSRSPSYDRCHSDSINLDRTPVSDRRNSVAIPVPVISPSPSNVKNLLLNSNSQMPAHHISSCLESTDKLQMVDNLNMNGSIIKDILLRARNASCTPADKKQQLDSTMECSMCCLNLGSKENLDIHRLYYCPKLVNRKTSLFGSNYVEPMKEEASRRRSDNVMYMGKKRGRPQGSHNKHRVESSPKSRSPTNSYVARGSPFISGGNYTVNDDQNNRGQSYPVYHSPSPSPKRPHSNSSELNESRKVSRQETVLKPGLQLFGGEVQICDGGGLIKKMTVDTTINFQMPIAVTTTKSVQSPLRKTSINSTRKISTTKSEEFLSRIRAGERRPSVVETIAKPVLNSGGTVVQIQTPTADVVDSIPFSLPYEAQRELLSSPSPLNLSMMSPRKSVVEPPRSVQERLKSSPPLASYRKRSVIDHKTASPTKIAKKMSLAGTKLPGILEKLASSAKIAAQVSSKPPEKVEDKEPPAPVRPNTLDLNPIASTNQLIGTTLVSPETPRENKKYGQCYRNGQYYTYLELKSSTRVYYCTIFRPQPMYVSQSIGGPKLSMYSNWQLVSPKEDPNGSKTAFDSLGLYRSSWANGSADMVAGKKEAELIFTESGYGKDKAGMVDLRSMKDGDDESQSVKTQVNEYVSDSNRNGLPDLVSSSKSVAIDDSTRKAVSVRKAMPDGGFKANDEYTYIRGRGRGRYVCSECGIRCKKPSMLKKHIRTHTDLRPYSCLHCSFSFKTKGNLTKHMKSKAHRRKCIELGLEVGSSDLQMYTDDDETDSNGDQLEMADLSDVGDDEGSESGDDTDSVEGEEDYHEGYLSGTDSTSNSQVSHLLPPRLAVVSPRKDSEGTGNTPEIMPIIAELPQSMANDNGLLSSTVTPSQVNPSTEKSFAVFVDDDKEDAAPIDLSRPKPILENLLVHGSGLSQMPVLRKLGESEMIPARGSIFSTGSGKQPPVASVSPLPVERASIKLSRAGLPDFFKTDAFIGADFQPRLSEDGKSVCSICQKSFTKPSQLRLHFNIHYFERPFRCDSCAVSFRTKGHLQKHARSISHYNKTNMNITFGAATTDNPRPFKCTDCKIAFRIHGHLAKHLRSKMHIMKLECLGKLPFGTYAEIERSGANLNEIDTTDCDNSLESLQVMAQKLCRDGQLDSASLINPARERTFSNSDNNSDLSMDDLDGIPMLRTDSFGGKASDRGSPCSDCESMPPPLIGPMSRDHGGGIHFEDISDADSEGEELDVLNDDNIENICTICNKVMKSAKFLQLHLYVEHPDARDWIVHQQESYDKEALGIAPRYNNSVTVIGKTTGEKSAVDLESNVDLESISQEGDCNDDELSPRKYDCDICGKRFSSRTPFKQHLLTHTLIRPFICEICDAGFQTEKQLEAHSEIHSQTRAKEARAADTRKQSETRSPSVGAKTGTSADVSESNS